MLLVILLLLNTVYIYLSMYISLSIYIYLCILEADENGDEQKGNQEKKELGDEKAAPYSNLVPLSSAIIDHEIEILLSEWSKNADMLFSIHPMDGSLLVWHVDWLDEYQPGMFRQVQVLYSSCILHCCSVRSMRGTLNTNSFFLKIAGVICLKNSCCISNG